MAILGEGEYLSAKMAILGEGERRERGGGLSINKYFFLMRRFVLAIHCLHLCIYASIYTRTVSRFCFVHGGWRSVYHSLRLHESPR